MFKEVSARFFSSAAITFVISAGPSIIRFLDFNFEKVRKIFFSSYLEALRYLTMLGCH